MRPFVKWSATVATALLIVLGAVSCWYSSTIFRTTPKYSLILFTDRGSACVEVTYDWGYRTGWGAGFAPRDPPECHFWNVLWDWSAPRSTLPSGGWARLFQVPAWLLILITGAPAATLWWNDYLSARRRARQGLCPKCGYPRTGLAPSATCPECGAIPK